MVWFWHYCLMTIHLGLCHICHTCGSTWWKKLKSESWKQSSILDTIHSSLSSLKHKTSVLSRFLTVAWLQQKFPSSWKPLIRPIKTLIPFNDVYYILESKEDLFILYLPLSVYSIGTFMCVANYTILYSLWSSWRGLMGLTVHCPASMQLFTLVQRGCKMSSNQNCRAWHSPFTGTMQYNPWRKKP